MGSFSSLSSLVIFKKYFIFLFQVKTSKTEEKEEEPKKCENFEMCGKRTEMFCPTCKMFICDSCDPSHTSSIFSRNHKREQRNDFLSNEKSEREGKRKEGEWGFEDLKKIQCPKHSSELICGYCFACCGLVCVRCILDLHGEHREEVRTLEQSVLKKRDVIVKVGVELDNRLIDLEERGKKVEREMKELEEKLEKKRIEKKEIELEKDDLKIRKDSIIRLSNTPSDLLFFNEELFSSLFQTANEIVSESGFKLEENSKPRKKGVICCGGDGYHFVSSASFPVSILGVRVKKFRLLYVSDGLRMNDKDGKEIDPLQTALDSQALTNAIDVANGLDDQLVVLDQTGFMGYRIVILNKEGELINSFELKNTIAVAVVVDREGRILIASSLPEIQVFTNDGRKIRSFGSQGHAEGEFCNPCRMAIDNDGNVIICDYGNHRIQVMDIEGNFIRCFGTIDQLKYPSCVDVDGEDRIVVSSHKKVSVFEKDGTFLFSFGEDHFKRPFKVVVALDGSIIVSDSFLDSVQLWQKK